MHETVFHYFAEKCDKSAVTVFLLSYLLAALSMCTLQKHSICHKTVLLEIHCY